ncbi:MAG: hypothetical protein H6628_02465 [Calditrichae bacterium]|nr:hypothetical protein [Calditrichia bacterium]
MSKLLHKILILLSVFALFSFAVAQQAQFADLYVDAENHPEPAIAAQQVAAEWGLPVHLFIPDVMIAEPLAVENGRLLYGVITNFLHPLRDGRVLAWEALSSMYDLDAARIRYGDGRIVNGHIGQPIATRPRSAAGDSLLMILNSTDDNVMLFDYATGDLVDVAFIPGGGNLSTPIQAQLSPRGTITVSDQIQDLVQEYDTSGVYIGPYAPAGGVNNAILNNVRGHQYRPDGTLLACNSDASNVDAIAAFDTAGVFLGNFIANNAGGLDSPWDILFRSSGDVLVSTSVSDALHRYDINGNYLDDFVTGINFARQMVEMPNGNIAVANFSGTGTTGIQIYDSAGNFLTLLDAVTGNRGLWLLGNGNFITTNGAGVHEVDPNTNTLVRTQASGTAMQHIGLYVPQTGGGVPGNPPSNVTATGGSSSVQLTWDAPIDGVELLYDDNTGEGNLSIGATAEGDLAVRFTPNVYPSTLLSIKVWFSATADPAAMTSGNYTVWDGTSAGPGTSLATGSHPINRGGFETVDVSSAGVTINSDDFFISYNEPNGEALFITWDTDGVQRPLLGECALDRLPWQTLGNTGIAGFDNNLMIRAIVQEGSGPNARIVELGSDGSRHTLPMSDLKSLFRQFNAQGGAAGYPREPTSWTAASRS